MENTIVFSCWSSEKKQTFLYVYSHAIICAQHSKKIFWRRVGGRDLAFVSFCFFLLFLNGFFLLGKIIFFPLKCCKICWNHQVVLSKDDFLCFSFQILLRIGLITCRGKRACVRNLCIYVLNCTFIPPQPPFPFCFRPAMTNRLQLFLCCFCGTRKSVCTYTLWPRDDCTSIFVLWFSSALRTRGLHSKKKKKKKWRRKPWRLLTCSDINLSDARKAIGRLHICSGNVLQLHARLSLIRASLFVLCLFCYHQ